MSRVFAYALERRAVIPPPSRSTTINIVSWVLLALIISTLVARFAVKLSGRTSQRRIAKDDVLLVVAALFSFGQTVAVSTQWKDNKSERQLQTSYDNSAFQKTAYISSILFIANLGCAKMCLSLFMRKLFVGRLFEYTSLILVTFTASWTISGIFVTAFQCRMPTPWDVLSSECIDIIAFGNYLASTNIATEILLVLVPLATWIQETSVGNRHYVFAVFWSRSSIVVVVSVQLYFFNTWVASPSVAESWAVSLCMQVTQTLSIVSACLLGLHPLLAKDMSDTSSIYTETNGLESRWDARKFGSLSYSYVSQRSIDSHNPHEPAISPYCRPLATHGLVRSSASYDSYSFPRFPSNIALPLSTPEPPVNVFNRLVRSSSSLDLDPLGRPRNLEELGCLPAPDWEDEEVGEMQENAQSGSNIPDRRPTSEYIFQRSKVISVPEERNMYEIGREWTGFVPPLPTPKVFDNPPRFC